MSIQCPATPRPSRRRSFSCLASFISRFRPRIPSGRCSSTGASSAGNWKGNGPIEYWLITTGPPDQPGINGGLLRRRGPAPTQGQSVNAYVCTLEVPSVDEHENKVIAAGGKTVVPKMPIPGLGWLVYCTDPEGNIFGMMQNDPSAK